MELITPHIHRISRRGQDIPPPSLSIEHHMNIIAITRSPLPTWVDDPGGEGSQKCPPAVQIVLKAGIKHFYPRR